MKKMNYNTEKLNVALCIIKKRINREFDYGCGDFTNGRSRSQSLDKRYLKKLRCARDHVESLLRSCK